MKDVLTAILVVLAMSPLSLLLGYLALLLAELAVD
jgi:hypothetical protein